MKKTLKITLLVIVYLLAFSTSVQAYTANFSGTPTSVNSEETFTVKITVDEATTLANSHIKYDSSLFTFVSATQTNLSAAIYNSEGEISWMYTDLNANSQGVKTFEFTFKAKEVTGDKTGIFQMSDATFITVGEKTYEGNNIKGDKNIAVTVKSGKGTSLSSKNNTSTSGSSTNKTSTTTYNNSNTDTTTNKNSLPKTGEDAIRNIALIAGTTFIVLAIAFKKKAKNLF